MGDMFNTGIELMFIGMGIVFVFLAMLVVAVTFMSWTISRFLPEATDSLAGPRPKSVKQDEDDGELIAAIGAAIHRYRKDRPD